MTSYQASQAICSGAVCVLLPAWDGREIPATGVDPSGVLLCIAGPVSTAVPVTVREGKSGPWDVRRIAEYLEQCGYQVTVSAQTPATAAPH